MTILIWIRSVFILEKKPDMIYCKVAKNATSSLVFVMISLFLFLWCLLQCRPTCLEKYKILNKRWNYEGCFVNYYVTGGRSMVRKYLGQNRKTNRTNYLDVKKSTLFRQITKEISMIKCDLNIFIRHNETDVSFYLLWVFKFQWQWLSWISVCYL